MTRKDRLQQLADDYGLDPEDASTSANEDIAEYLLDGKEIGRWAAVTSGAEWTYIYPDYATAEAAQAKTVEHLGDDIFAEGPVMVIDLDTGTELVPDWDALPWKVGGPGVEQARELPADYPFHQ